MNLRQMEVFRAVMLTGTVAGAAEALHVSQPTVSKALSLGERRAGLRLFDRVKGRLIATPEGKRLYEEVDRLWTGVEKVRALASELADPTAGRLQIVASPSLGSALIPAAVAGLQREVVDLKVKVDLLVPHLLRDAVMEQSVDVGLTLFRIDHPSVAQVAHYECGWVCVMAKGHPLSKKSVISPADLIGYKLISFPPQPTYDILPEIIFGAALGKLEFGVEVRAGQSACLFSAAGPALRSSMN